MPDRAVIPLMTALAGGFIAGACLAITQTYGTTVWIVGGLVGLVVAVTGFVSVVKTPGAESERKIVGLVRALVAAATFGFLYAGIIVAVRDGSIVGLIWLAFAAGFALLLTRFRVRDRGELQTQ
jgi:hypothetical protein